jgi:virginiamycin A acetyltransferase
MKNTIKLALNLFGQLLVLPFILLTRAEELLSKDGEVIFNTCAQFMAVLPGLPGAFLRRSYYTLTLEKCSPHCHIGFGAVISHRYAIIEPHVYIGNYALIGSAHLGERCLIGSRASIISGKYLHEKNPDGTWSTFSSDRLERILVGKNVWIGEGAIILADIGEGSCVGAGSVVSVKVKPNIMVVGNPARFVKNFEPAEQHPAGPAGE